MATTTSSEHNDDERRSHQPISASAIVPANPILLGVVGSPPLVPVPSCPSVSHHQITESSSTASASSPSLSSSSSSSSPPPHQANQKLSHFAQQQFFAQQQQQLIETAPPQAQASSSISRVSTLETTPPAALPGYAAVRDDIELDIYSLFFSPPSSTSVGGTAAAIAAEVQQVQQPQPQQVQPQPQPQPQPQLLQEQLQQQHHREQQQHHHHPPSPVASSVSAGAEPPTNGAVIMPERTHAAMASLTSFPTVPLVMPDPPTAPAPGGAHSAASGAASSAGMGMPQPMLAPLAMPPATMPMPSVVSPELPPGHHQGGSSSLAAALAAARAQREAHERRGSLQEGAVAAPSFTQQSAPSQQEQEQEPAPAPLAPPQRQLAQLAPASSSAQQQKQHLQRLGFQALQIHLRQQQQAARPAAPSPSSQPPPQQPPPKLPHHGPSASSSPVADEDAAAAEAAMEAQRIAAAMSRRNFAPKKKRRKSLTEGAANTSATGGGPPKKRGYSSPYISSSSSSSSVVGGRTSAASSSSSSSAEESPHSYVLSLLLSRGYPTSIHKSSECGYKSSPSLGPPAPLQLASYGTAVLRAAQSDDSDGTLGALLGSGLSPNPCNRFSESVLDMSAKRGLANAFRVQLEHGADVQTADDFGRTPLHHAAWGSGSGSSSSDAEEARFDIVARILLLDPDMVRVADDRGQCPLEYVRGSEERGRWVDFLKKNADRFWPAIVRANVAADVDGPPPRGLPEEQIPRPKRRPAGARIPDPPDALPVEVAKLVASGRVKPEEARNVHPDSLPLEQDPPPQVAGAFKFPSMLASYHKTSG